jgi:hypothetical protein
VRFSLGLLILAFALRSSAISVKNDPLPTIPAETNLHSFTPDTNLPVDPYSVNSENGSNATRDLFSASLLTEANAVTNIDEPTQIPVLAQQSAQEPTSQGATSKNSSTEAGTAKSLTVSALPVDPYSVNSENGSNATRDLFSASLLTEANAITNIDEPTQSPVLAQQSAQEPTSQGATSKNSSTEAGTAKSPTVSALPASEGGLTVAAEAGPSQQKPSNIPPGFESLFEDQQSLVDVYFAGRLLVTTGATFNPSSITFEQPSNIASRIPSALDLDVIQNALTGELPANQEFLCYYRNQRNCGVMYPEVASVIFDSDKFRADLFINPSLLGVSQANHDKYLPPSDGGLSFLQTFNYAFSGNDESGSESIENLYALSLLSYEENAIQMSSNYDNDSNFEIDTLVAQRDWQGMRYLGGYFQTINGDLRFTSETSVVGARIGTSLDTREDERQTSGRQIQVFLQSRGEVSIFKNERLISTRIYDAGNQIIDTSALPGGAYDITLRIRDSGGERIETQFYVKNNNLPPEGDPYYFIELGQVTEFAEGDTLPETIDEHILRGSVNTRLNFNNSIFGGLSTTEDDSVAEIGWFGLGAHYDVQLSAALARHDRYGFNSEARFNFDRAWLIGTYRKIWDDGDEEVEGDEPDYGAINLIGPEQEQATLKLDFPWGISNVSTSIRYIDRPEQDSVTDYSARIDFEVFRTARSSTDFRFQVNHSDGDNFVLATLAWQMNQDHLSYLIRPEYNYEDSDDNINSYGALSASADWDSQELMSSDLRAGISGRLDDDFNSFGAYSDWGGRYGRVRGQVEHVDRDDGTSTNFYNGNLSTSFIVAKEQIAIGGKEQNQAAVVIDLRGDAGDSFFDIIVNGGRMGTAKAGTKTVLSLRPFESYSIRLNVRGNDFVFFDDKEHKVTLYPGNVVTLDWQADKVNIIFGRIQDSMGEPVANGLLQGVAGLATTDEFGVFQAEIIENVTEFQVKTRGALCTVKLPQVVAKNGIASVGNLHCQ